MANLIERDALKNHLYIAQAEAFKHSAGYVAGAIQSFIDLLDKQPTIEPEVRHGRWIELPKALNPAETPCQCSACKHILSFYYTTHKSNFCPNCGARMDGGADNAE